MKEGWEYKRFDEIMSPAKVERCGNVLPDYLTLVLNSIIVKMQAERDAGGSIIQHWKPSEIETVKVPILPKTIQKELSNKVQLCFALRKESEQLLQDAKSLVENVIYNNRYK